MIERQRDCAHLFGVDLTEILHPTLHVPSQRSTWILPFSKQTTETTNHHTPAPDSTGHGLFYFNPVRGPKPNPTPTYFVRPGDDLKSSYPTNP